MREAAVAGEFYEGDFDALNKQLLACFEEEYGPGGLPIKRSDSQTVKAAIVPHAGFQFSGPCAAWAYKDIAESSFPKTFVILGPNHFGHGSGLSIGDWKTPLGVVKVDKDLVRDIKEGTDLDIHEEYHLTEHSIEVQLPFLQFANKDQLSNIRIVPIVISNDLDFQKLGHDLFQVLKGRNVTILISTDFTHYGPHYAYVPFMSDVPERITKLDKDAIDLIMNYDTKGFKDYINKTAITICGFIPILVFLAYMGHVDDKPEAHMLMHYMSGDIVKDYKNSVSYASIVFK